MGSTRRHTGRVAASVALLATAVSLTGCTSPQATFDSAVGQGIAAVETALLAVDQRLDERTFTPTAIATLGDARRELVDASTSVAETDASDAADAALRADVLAALDAGLAAVNEARDAVAGGIGSLDAVVPRLEASADELTELQSRTSGGGR